MKRYHFVPPGGGPSYDWSKDHTVVKVSTTQSGGAFALMEDNLKQGFSLGLHLHRHHAETFFILEGIVDFYIDGDWMTAIPGTTVHIPPSIPHALTIPDGQTGKLLMIFQPAGFDQYLAKLATMTNQDVSNKERMRELEEEFDIINLGDVPTRD